VTKRALDTYDGIVAAIGATASASMNALFPSSATNSLSAQLKMVARMIEQQATFGMKRQVFMVGMGGFDLHDFLATQHPPLLQKLSSAMKEFDDAMTSLGKGSQVTAFTASDFGRTLTFQRRWLRPRLGKPPLCHGWCSQWRKVFRHSPRNRADAQSTSWQWPLVTKHRC